MDEHTIINEFKKIFGFKPYNIQVQYIKSILDGKSPLYNSPTGSGKSNAVEASYILGKDKVLPKKMLLVNPSRTLTNAFADRAKKDLEKYNLKISSHHGLNPIDPYFESDIVSTTIDQLGCAYLGIPLSERIKNGNIIAGSIINSFIAFDEIQSYDAHRALQFILYIIDRQRKLGIPVSLMTATLPEDFILKASELFKLDPIILSDEESKKIKSRANRKVKIKFVNKKLSAKEVYKIYKNTDKNIIVVCNTVGTAISLYLELKKNQDIKDSVLLHSKFTPSHRNEKEEYIYKINNKKTVLNSRHIIISTQVIEVGVDISAYKVITELAPIDIIIQRAGRCQRWFIEHLIREGEIIIYLPMNGTYAPYFELTDIIDQTKIALIENDGNILDWKLERELINKILTDTYYNYLKKYDKFKIKIDRAYKNKNKKEASGLIREISTCSISIYDKPEEIKDDIYNLEKISFHVKTLEKNWHLLKGVKVVYNENTKEIELKELPSKPHIGDFYVLLPENIIYNKEIGFLIKEGETAECFKLMNNVKKQEKIDIEYKKELFLTHAKNVAINIYKKLEDDFILKKIFDKDDIKKVKAVITFYGGLHDLGKLTNKWVEYSGKEINERPLAHFEGKKSSPKPLYHDLIAAYLMHDHIRYITQKLNIKSVGDSLINAILFHHGRYFRDVRDKRHINIQDKFELIKDWEIEIKDYILWFKKEFKDYYNLLTENETFDFETNFIESISKKKIIKYIKYDNIIYVPKYKLYSLYSYFSYILRNADKDSLV